MTDDPTMSVECAREPQCICGKCDPLHLPYREPGDLGARPALERGPWIQTFTGKKMHPFLPSPESIDIVDIAHALSNLCRFTGHTTRFYSVAQHSVHAADVAEADCAAQALLHDAAEAYLNDIARPVKHALGMEGYREAEHRLMGGIFVRFGLPRQLDPRVEDIDARLLFTERVQLLARMADEHEREWGCGIEAHPYPIRLPTMTPRQAKDSFLNRFYHLFPHEVQP